MHNRSPQAVHRPISGRADVAAFDTPANALRAAQSYATSVVAAPEFEGCADCDGDVAACLAAHWRVAGIKPH